MNKPTFKHICLMHIQQLTNFPYIEKDFDALTDYGLLCKVVDYLNQVIASENAQNENILALYNAFTELKNYVENFFDNLDVQDEINNKLDEMASDGTLDQIIEQYLNSSAIWGFDTVADMKEATNLIDGSYARTLGYNTKNDGKGALYYITKDIEPSQHQEELDSGLYATLIVNNDTKNIKLILNNNKFKPQVSASMYTLDHDENTIKNRILKWKEMGVKGIIVLINLDNDESLTILDDLTKTKNLMNFAKENGLNVTTIKFHCLLRERVDSTTLNTYHSQVLSVLNELNAYQFGIRRITLFNELPYIYGPLADSSTKNNAIAIINNIKSLGYSVGITCSNLELGIGYMIQYSPSLCEAVDFFAFNYYQIFPFKKELTTYDDSIFAWDKALNSLYTYKQEYPDKDIILSETGCLDNWLNMMNPADFTLNQYPANGQTYPIYFYGLLNNKIANNDLKEVWLWYDEQLVNYAEVIDYFKYYLGGNSDD